MKNKKDSCLLKIWHSIYPEMGICRACKFHCYKVLRLSDNTKAIAIGLAFGAAISAMPLMGLHIVLGAALSLICRGNAVAAAVGTLWGNPLTFPFYWIGSFKLGMFLFPKSGLEHAFSLGGIERFTTKTVGMFWNFDFSGIYTNLTKIFDIWIRMMVGSIPFFIITWLVIYFISNRLISRFQIIREQKIYLGYLHRLRELPTHLRNIPGNMKERILKLRHKKFKKKAK